MKRKFLLFVLLSPLCSSLFAQKKVTAYAITGGQKGSNDWTEVRLVDVSTGEEVKTIYQKDQEVPTLNARTGKELAKKETATAKAVALDKPFATLSAACAYDKKHERLYYTPMGINQLRYIDLKSKSPKIYYFEDEAFGVLKSRQDVSNQITRMVIGSDGNGYALTNNGEHLIRFTTGKKPVITDLGTVSDDAGNAVSIHDGGGYGGDMIADAKGNLYLITANRGVYKISIDSKAASYIGFIRGLPRGFSTNGAVAEGGASVIVSSSSSTQGYYRFDLNTLKAEKLDAAGPVFNASDLANGTLAFEKKKKDRQDPPPAEMKPEEDAAAKAKPTADDVIAKNAISVFPNPVTTGLVKISFANQPAGKYGVQLLDVTGKLISSQEVTVTSKVQVEEMRLPEGIAKGAYVVKVVGATSKVSLSSQIVVQ